MSRWSCPISSSRGYLEISTELVVDVRDASLDVRDGDDRRLVEREVRVGQVLQRSVQRAPDARVIGDQPRGDPDADERQRPVDRRRAAASRSGGDSHAPTIVSTVTTADIHRGNRGLRTNSPSSTTMPYSAVIPMPSGNSRSTTKMTAAVRIGGRDEPAVLPAGSRRTGQRHVDRSLIKRRQTRTDAIAHGREMPINDA